MKRALRYCVLGACVGLVASACGSSNDKKATPNDKTMYEGDGGQAGGNNGGSKQGGGTDATAGSSVGASSGQGLAGEPTAPTAGSTSEGGTAGTSQQGGAPAMAGDAGTANATSDAGAAGHAAGGSGSNDCKGFGNCDANPDCERNFNLVTSCGACDKTCNSAQASVACEDETCVIKACNPGYGDCVNGADDGCETLLTSNAANCGECGRDCTQFGSTCASNKCNEVPLQVSQPVGANSWAYSAQGLLFAGFNSYSVLRFPLNGDARSTVWASAAKTSGVGGVLVLGNEVFWSELGTGGDDFTSYLYKKTITDDAAVSPTTVFRPEWKPIYLRKQGNAFYWFSGDYQSGDPGAWAYTRAIDAPDTDHGTKIMAIDQGTHNGMLNFNVTSNALYWASTRALTGTAYELRTAPLGGSPVSVVPAVSDAYPTVAISQATNGGPGVDLEVKGDTVYFNRDVSDAFDGIYSYKTGDARPFQIVLASVVTSLVVDENYVYYSRQNVAGVWRAKLTGSAGTQLSDDYLTKVIAVDDTFVYQVNAQGSLTKVIKL